MIKIKVRRMHEFAVLPKYATEGAACFDLRAAYGGYVLEGERHSFSTGLEFEIPPGHVMFLYSRSGHGFKHGIRLANGTGVIDSDYRGELKVCLQNDGWEAFIVEEGDRIAQAMVMPIQAVEFEEVLELSHTARGAGGFGSTGK